MIDFDPVSAPVAVASSAAPQRRCRGRSVPCLLPPVHRLKRLAAVGGESVEAGHEVGAELAEPVLSPVGRDLRFRFGGAPGLGGEQARPVSVTSRTRSSRTTCTGRSLRRSERRGRHRAQSCVLLTGAARTLPQEGAISRDAVTHHRLPVSIRLLASQQSDTVLVGRSCVMSCPSPPLWPLSDPKARRSERRCPGAETLRSVRVHLARSHQLASLDPTSLVRRARRARFAAYIASSASARAAGKPRSTLIGAQPTEPATPALSRAA